MTQTWITILELIWLTILTILLLVVIRQVMIITERGTVASDSNPDKLRIGTSLPSGVVAKWPELDEATPRYLIFLSSGCDGCTEFLRTLRGHLEEATRFPNVALVALGRHRLLEVYPPLPETWTWIFDPDATALADNIGVRSSPIALQIEQGFITGLSEMPSWENLERFISSRPADIQELVSQLKTERTRV